MKNKLYKIHLNYLNNTNDLRKILQIYSIGE